MAWHQELRLLDRLSAATCVTEFALCHTDIDSLNHQVQDLTQGNFKHLLSDGVFARRLITAASRALIVVCISLKDDSSFNTADSRHLRAFLAIVQDVLQTSMSLAPAAYAQGQHADRSRAAQHVGFLAVLQGTIKQTDLVENLAKACAALTTAARKILQSKDTTSHHPGPTADDDGYVTAVSSISITVLELWSSLGAVWGTAAHGDMKATVHVPVQSGMHSWSDPKLQATIKPSFSLLMTLIHMQSHGSTSTSSLLVFSRRHAAIWDAIFAAIAYIGSNDMAYVCSEGMTEYARGTPSAAALSVIQSTMKNPDVQELQLFILAAAVGGSHQRQKGASPAIIHVSADHHSVTDITKRSGRDQQKQPSKQLQVADHSSQVLQQLGLSKDHGQQFYKMFISRNGTSSRCLGSIIVNAMLTLRYGSSDEQLFDSPTASSFPILKVQLVVETMLLLPDVDENLIIPCALVYWIMTANAWNTYHLRDVGDGGDWSIRSSVAAAVADSILAPLLLEVGPVVLALEHDHCTSQWAAAVKHFWSFVLMNTPEATRSDTSKPTCNIFHRVMQQDLCSAASALEAAIRATASDLPIEHYMSKSLPDRYAMSNMLQLVAMSADALASNKAVPAGTASVTLSSRSTHSKQGSVSSKSLTVKPCGLFISGLKLLGKHVAATDKDEKINATTSALHVFEAAKNLVSAATTGTSISSSAAAAVPWLHVTARALHCCATAILSLSDTDDHFLKFYFVWMRLVEDVNWFRKQLKLLSGHDAGSSISSSNPSSSNISGSTAARMPAFGLLPQALLQKLLQQSNQLMKDLMRVEEKRLFAMMAMKGESDYQPDCKDPSTLAEQLRQFPSDLCAALPTLLCCNNPSCSTVTGVSEWSCVGRRKCSRCQAAGYCSKECQKQHWSQHKRICGWLIE